MLLNFKIRIVFIIVFTIVISNSYSQSYTSGGNTGFNSWSIYQTNSPTNIYGNRYNCININRDSIILRTKYIMLDSMYTNNNVMNINGRIAWVDGRQIKLSKFDSLPLSYRQVSLAIGGAPSTLTPVNSDWNSLSGLSKILNKPTIPTNNNQLINGNGYISSYTEIDPLWIASPSFSVTGTNITNWNTAFGWGNHALAGYLTPTSTNILTNKSGNISQWTNNLGYLTAEVDGSITNELQTLSLSGQTVSISSGNSFVIPTQTTVLTSSQVTNALTYVPLQIEVDGSITNEIQTLSVNGQNLSLSGANTIVMPSNTLTVLTASTGISVTNGSIITNILPNITPTITAGTGILINNSGNSFTTTNTLPDQTVILTAGNANIVVSGTYPSFVLTPYSPSTFTVTRAINSSSFQPSITNIAWVYYTIRINCVATIGGTSSGTVTLQYSINNGSTWLDVGQVENSNIVTLALVLNSNITQTSQLCGVIPSGAIVRMIQASSGTTTITYVKGQETF